MQRFVIAGCLFQQCGQIKTVTGKTAVIIRQTECFASGIGQIRILRCFFRDQSVIHAAENDMLCIPERQIQKTADLHGISGMFRITGMFPERPDQNIKHFRTIKILE